MNQWYVPVLGGLFVVSLGIVLARRRGAVQGRTDPFHPLLFPTLYVTVATLAPVAWLYGTGDDLGYISMQQLSPATPLLSTLAVIGFAVGASLRFHPPSRQGALLDRNTLIYLGRVLLLLPLGAGLWNLQRGIVLTRGSEQATFTLSDSFGAAVLMAAPTAVLLLLAGNMKGGRRLLSVLDWTLVGSVLILVGLNGRRAAAIAILLVILIFVIHRAGGSLTRLVLGLITLVAFVYAVLAYRITTNGEDLSLSPLEALLRDLGAVGYSIGATDLLNPVELQGSTILAGLVRQLPSPIVNSLIGPPTDTGAYRFRDLTNTASDQGYGFSLPAEGVLNFGALGAFLLPLAIGAALAWLYARSDLDGTRAIGWAYAVATATFPFAWRSDVLGAVKGVLYPVIMLAFACMIARTTYAYLRRRGRVDAFGEVRPSTSWPARTSTPRPMNQNKHVATESKPG